MDVFMVWTILFFSWEPIAQGKEGEDPKYPQIDRKLLLSVFPFLH